MKIGTKKVNIEIKDVKHESVESYSLCECFKLFVVKHSIICISFYKFSIQMIFEPLFFWRLRSTNKKGKKQSSFIVNFRLEDKY